jgi:hypothetical protein
MSIGEMSLMSVAELLDALKEAQISLAVDGESLVVKASKGRITEEIKNSLKQNKEKLIAVLKSDCTIGSNGRDEYRVPAILIGPESRVITPEMLPLIDLTQEDIDRIVEQVPGGVGNIQDIYALSPLQEGILFHHLLARESDPYVLGTEMSFATRELLDRFLSAVQQVIHRHDILRTAFVWEGISKPAQVVWRQAKVSVTEFELEGQTGAVEERLARQFDTQRQHIDVRQAPLLRYGVAYDAEQDRWVLLQRMHHLIGDHSTLEMLRSEVYAVLTGQGHQLGEPQPFRNLVAQARLGIRQEEHERFFGEMLGEINEPTLPFGLADVHQGGGEIRESRRMLPQALNDRLRAQARRIGVSLASLCHAAWGQVLACSSGQERVVFGTVLFGRMQG